MDIIERNFFCLIRSGGLNEFVALEPMSNFKWRKLMAIAADRHIADVITKGMRNHQYDTGMQIPKELLSAGSADGETARTDTQPNLANRLLNKRLKKIHYNEHHAIDTSVVTLELLDLIVICITTMLNHDASINRLLKLGVFLRTKGDKVDFVKLDRWLTRLHLQRMAQLQGCMLILAFGFEQDEVPFVHRTEPAAHKLLNYSLCHNSNEYEEWHVSENKPVFIKTNSRALFHNVRRCARYFGYAPLESTSSLFGKMARSISEIEE